jgi:predicted GNAT family N-acyltransferase
VIIGPWEVLGVPAHSVRQAVFVVEQAIAPEEEWDAWDARSLHAVAQDEHGDPIGTGRLLPAAFDPAAPGSAHVGRMAVLASARRAGVGGSILARLMQEARRLGFSRVELNAQTYVAAFYARHGFVAVGAEFFEVGIAHVKMRAAL